MRFVNFICAIIALISLNSCVLQTSSTWASTAISRPGSTDLQEATFYRIGENYYVGFRARYTCQPDSMKIVFLPAHGKPAATLYAMDEMKGEEETFYILLSAEQVHTILGKTIQEPSEDAPRFITGKDWDDSAAQACPITRDSRPKSIRTVDDSGLSAHEAYCTLKQDYIEASLPVRIGWDMAYKFPLSLAQLVCVDVPGTIVLNTAGAVFGVVYIVCGKPIDYLRGLNHDEHEKRTFAPEPPNENIRVD